MVETEHTRSFQAIFRTHYPEIVRHLLRIVSSQEEAEDLAQMVFLRLHQNFDKVHDEQARAWLYRVATNLGYNAVRNRKRFTQWQTRASSQPAPAPPQAQPEAALFQARERAQVRNILGQLPERDARLLTLYYAGRKSYRELAQELQVKASSVGTLLARAKRTFARVYQEHGEAPHKGETRDL